jgi:hypothetical protein
MPLFVYKSRQRTHSTLLACWRWHERNGKPKVTTTQGTPCIFFQAHSDGAPCQTALIGEICERKKDAPKEGSLAGASSKRDTVLGRSALGGSNRVIRRPYKRGDSPRAMRSFSGQLRFRIALLPLPDAASARKILRTIAAGNDPGGG